MGGAVRFGGGNISLQALGAVGGAVAGASEGEDKLCGASGGGDKRFVLDQMEE